MVSSRFHLGITLGQVVSVLPLTSVERRGWMHRIHVAAGAGWVITEQVRTVSITRFRRYAPEITLSGDELDEVQHMLAQMLTVSRQWP